MPMVSALLSQRCSTVVSRTGSIQRVSTAVPALKIAYGCKTQASRRLQGTPATQSSISGTMPTPILTYFDIPGRGEIARLCFTLGGVDFEEKLVPGSEWPSIKPTTPFGQIPMLQIGDIVVSQSAGIDHFAARAGGFIPDDPIQELLSDQAYFFVTQDLHAAILSPTMKIPKEEAIIKRRELAAGVLKDKLAMLDKLVANRPGKFTAGDKLSLGDFAIFNFLGMIKSEFFEGVPPALLDGFAALKSYRNAVASEPGVKNFYDQATLEIRVKGYRPDDEAA